MTSAGIILVASIVLWFFMICSNAVNFARAAAYAIVLFLAASFVKKHANGTVENAANFFFWSLSVALAFKLLATLVWGWLLYNHECDSVMLFFA